MTVRGFVNCVGVWVKLNCLSRNHELVSIGYLLGKLIELSTGLTKYSVDNVIHLLNKWRLAVYKGNQGVEHDATER